MAQLLIRDLEPDLVQRLKERAHLHNRSLQGEVKTILEESARLTVAETLDLALSWQRRLAGRPQTDSADVVREDRER
ncbi:MAG: FitA-like ribbon-helix-helix domain-containing protein [Deferrisomatales bacterium]